MKPGTHFYPVSYVIFEDPYFDSVERGNLKEKIEYFINKSQYNDGENKFRSYLKIQGGCVDNMETNNIKYQLNDDIDILPILIDSDYDTLALLINNKSECNIPHKRNNLTVSTLCTLHCCIKVPEPVDWNLFYSFPIIKQYESDLNTNIIKAFRISSRYANGIDVHFRDDVIIKPCGIAQVYLCVSKCYHFKPDLFVLRSSFLKKGLTISGIKHVKNTEDMLEITLANESKEEISGDRFLVLLATPLLNGFLGYYEEDNFPIIGRNVKPSGEIENMKVVFVDMDRKKKNFE